jgi:hypothetical protein
MNVNIVAGAASAHSGTFSGDSGHQDVAGGISMEPFSSGGASFKVCLDRHAVVVSAKSGIRQETPPGNSGQDATALPLAAPLQTTVLAVADWVPWVDPTGVPQNFSRDGQPATVPAVGLSGAVQRGVAGDAPFPLTSLVRGRPVNAAAEETEAVPPVAQDKAVFQNADDTGSVRIAQPAGKPGERQPSRLVQSGMAQPENVVLPPQRSTWRATAAGGEGMAHPATVPAALNANPVFPHAQGPPADLSMEKDYSMAHKGASALDVQPSQPVPVHPAVSPPLDFVLGNGFAAAGMDVPHQDAVVAGGPQSQAPPAPFQAQVGLLQQQFPGMVMSQARLIQEKGSATFTVTLHPAELGAIQVRVSSGADGGVTVQIATTSAAVQSLLHHYSSGLREQLQQLGMHVQQFTVTTSLQAGSGGFGFAGGQPNGHGTGDPGSMGAPVGRETAYAAGAAADEISTASVSGIRYGSTFETVA